MYLDKNEKISNTINNHILLGLLVFGISSIFSFIIFVKSPPTDRVYYLLPILPLAFGLICLLFIDVFRYLFESKVFTIIIIGYFIKMDLYPLLYCLSGYSSFFSGYATVNNLSKAITYFIFEFVCIMIACKYNIPMTSNKDRSLIVENTIYNKSTFKFIVVLLFLFLIFVYYYVSELRTIYFLPTEIDMDKLASIRWDNETIVARGSIKRYLYTLFMFIWPIVRYVFPVTMISGIYVSQGMTKKSVWMSGLCCLLPCIFLGGDNFAPFLAVSISLIVIRKLYGPLSNVLFGIIISLSSVLLLIIVSSKLVALTNWRGATGITNLAQLINGYFPGIENLALTMQIDGNNKLDTLFYDFYSGIPFASTIFGLNGASFNDLFNDYVNTGGQIVPFGGNIGYYTTYFISPVVVGLLIKLALVYENKSNKTDEFWTYYIYMLFSTYTAISVIIYSSQIYLRFYFYILIPILIIRSISKVSLK